MRIVGGQYKGRALSAPKGKNTRPTSDRAREALFNVLAHARWAPDLENVRVIDLFAGSGALGLEAMSRGAGFCLFVESETAARGALRDNLQAFELFGHTRIHRRDATALGKLPANLGAPFDLAFLDPPYGKGLGTKALSQLSRGNWLSENALTILEVGKDEEPDTTGWEVLDTRQYGAAKILFLKQN